MSHHHHSEDAIDLSDPDDVAVVEAIEEETEHELREEAEK